MLEQNKIKELFDSRDYTACIAQINKLANEDLDTNILRMKGYALQRTDRFEEGMEVWNILVANDPKQSEFYAERAVCKFHLKFKSTLSDLDLAVEFDDENPYRYACRAFIKDKLGNTTGAIEDYKFALKLDPENEVTLNNLGLLEEKLGYQGYAKMHYQQADALSSFRKSLERDEITNLENPSKLANTQSDKVIHPQEPSVKVFDELKKMVSSTTEFKKFWREAIGLMRKKK